MTVHRQRISVLVLRTSVNSSGPSSLVRTTSRTPKSEISPSLQAIFGSDCPQSMAAVSGARRIGAVQTGFASPIRKRTHIELAGKAKRCAVR